MVAEWASAAEAEPELSRQLDLFCAIAPAALIANVRTDVRLLSVGGKVLPVTINEAEWENSYVASPFTHYISYCRYELYHLGFKPLELLLSGLLALIGYALKAGRLNRVVAVNNFLLSTNLYPALTPDEVKAAKKLVLASYPGHAIVFRSLNEHPANVPAEVFLAAGFQPVASRQLYVQSPSSSEVRTSKGFKQDQALARKSPYQMHAPGELKDREYARVLRLYELLYLEKYSHLNPQLTVEFVRWAHESGFLKIHTLRKDGEIYGVAGFYQRGQFITCPLFGYDTSQPQEHGLYRLLSIFLIEEAGRLGALLNASSGAGKFKRSRGGKAYAEFSYVYASHLPAPRRAAWGFIGALSNTVVLPILRRLKL